MKFSVIFSSIALVAGVTAELQSRQVQKIVDVINDINEKTKALDSAVKSWNGKVADATDVLSASSDLGDTVSSGTSTVKGLQTLGNTDALELQEPVQDLTKTVKSVVDDLIAKKSTIVANGAGSAVEAQLTEQQSSSKGLSDAIVSKVPEALQSIATQLAGGISENLDRGVAAFKGTGSGSSSGGSGSSASGGSSATSAAASGSASASASASAGGGSSSAAGSDDSSSTSAAVAPTGTASTPTNGGSSPAVSSGPAQFTGAASTLNKIEGYGLAALLAGAVAVF